MQIPLILKSLSEIMILTISNLLTYFETANCENSILNVYGLIPNYRKAVMTQLDLAENYLEESHAYCEIIEIWRMIN